MEKHKPLNICVSDTIGVTDHCVAETELDAVIYRYKFEDHYKLYKEKKTEEELIFCFIFMQIYVECFLHQNMRKIVELEFKHSKGYIYEKWSSREKKYVWEKIDRFSSLFSAPLTEAMCNNIEAIIEKYNNISRIRNGFIHGSKVATWSDSDGKMGSTPASSLLTEKQLLKSIDDANNLGLSWDSLLDEIFPQCKSLRTINNFKFLQIEINR
jgi:hypothetical protein